MAIIKTRVERLKEVAERMGNRPVLIALAYAGDDYGDPQAYKVVGSTAVIDVVGPLSNDSFSWGGTTYGDLQKQIALADADDDVDGVLFCFNSPGGETDNAFETAAAIRGMSKPCMAVAATSCYSAAYLLASQCDQIFCYPSSGGVGSIGVYSQHFDVSDMLKQQGVDVTLFSAGAGKTNGTPYAPLTDEAKTEFQASVDRLYSAFTQAVASGRNMSTDDVVKLGAHLFQGAPEALASKLADRSGDVNDAWSALEGSYTDDTDDDEDMSALLKRFSSRMSVHTVATATNRKETRMEITKKPLAETTKTYTSAEVEVLTTAAKTEGHEAGYAAGYSTAQAEAEEIVSLCAIANAEPAKAVAFINSKTKVTDVRKALVDAAARTAAKTDINTATQPGSAGELAAADRPATDSADAEKKYGKAKAWSDVLGKFSTKGRK